MKLSRRLALTLAALMALVPVVSAEPLPNRGTITWGTRLQDVIKIEQEIETDNPPQHVPFAIGKVTSYVFREHTQLLGAEVDMLMYLFNHDQLIQIHYDVYEEEAEGGAEGFRAMLAKLTDMHGEPLSTDWTEAMNLSNILAEEEVYFPEMFKGYHEWMIDEDTHLSIYYRDNAYVVSYTNYPWVAPLMENGAS